ncbi:hypothetical protein EWM62_11020 [Mucilaginibacter terrigena]|uniref:Uncharacterized protein n=1 Tax=Mucilaginibacter terrigena TaxID=2492395 RepID=A0A4Q5LM92_9SPHI|nr:hypothetical protein [Mucilaginibacter terrigena]RYU90065.1 hypothetical protein EWM62_11020 [Mucilaginibacter terrigena]
MAADTVELFNDSLLTSRYIKVSMYGDNMNIAPVCPKFYKPDYGIMHFVCLSQTSKVYTVLNGKADVKYLPRVKGYDFITWEKYILSSFGVKRTTENGSRPVNDQPLRISPGSADTVVIPKGLEMFCPVKLKGDWLKVKYDCFYNDEDTKHKSEPCNSYISECKNPTTGWIRWHEGNKLLIDIFVME